MNPNLAQDMKRRLCPNGEAHKFGRRKPIYHHGSDRFSGIVIEAYIRKCEKCGYEITDPKTPKRVK